MSTRLRFAIALCLVSIGAAAFAYRDARHASHFLLVHADDGVGRVRFTPWRGAIGLDFATHLIGVFFKDGVHPCLFSDEYDH